MNDETRVMVAKRGGGLEMFEPGKPRRCLAIVLQASGREARFAGALARAVELHLRDWPASSPPSSSYVFHCLKTALAETGMEGAARRLAMHRRQRADRRRRLKVFDPKQPRRAPAPWRKATLAATLEAGHGLSHRVARIIAGETERRVLALQYSVVSKSLVRELLRCELLAWGLGDVSTDLVPDTPGADRVAKQPTRKEEC